MWDFCASLTRHEHTMSQVNIQIKSHKQLTWICAFGAWKFLLFFLFFSSLPLLKLHSQWLSSSTSFSLSLCRDPTHSVPCTWFHVNFCSEYRDFFGFCFPKRNFFFNYINSKFQRVEQRRYDVFIFSSSLFFASQRNMSTLYVPIEWCGWPV